MAYVLIVQPSQDMLLQVQEIVLKFVAMEFLLIINVMTATILMAMDVLLIV